jgi:hypothetical protein
MNPEIAIPWDEKVKEKGTIFKFPNHDAELVIHCNNDGYMYQSPLYHGMVVKVGDSLFHLESWVSFFYQSETLILRLDKPIYKSDKNYYISGENNPIATEEL